jgi:hypothetical protein
MIPENKLFMNYVAWGIVYIIGGIVFGLNFYLGLYINAFLVLLAAAIAVRKFIFGATLSGLNMLSAIITLYIYCSLSSDISCERNPYILTSFTPVLFLPVWFVFFVSFRFSKLSRHKK